MINDISKMPDEFYKGKKVLVRVDFNVNIQNGNIGEDYRIRMTIPTIEYLTRRMAKVILVSHLGRPKNRDISFSLAPVSKRLSEILQNTNVRFVDDCVGPQVKQKVSEMKNTDVLLLENLRFYKEEESNSPEFSSELASLADVYVNDGFSTSHRKHSSTYGSAMLFKTRLAGFNLKKEIEYLTMIKEKPKKPFVLIIGGVKIRDKIGALENLLPKADKILMGGAAAYTFLKAKGFKVGKSPVDEEHLPWVTKSISKYGDKIILPVDHVVSNSLENHSIQIVSNNIPDDMTGYDIGTETINIYSKEISENISGTLFWNGPMGFFEVSKFANGTINIAKSMALAYWRGSNTLIGGGDTLEAMKKAGVSEKEVTHVSTGGGATLRFLAGDEMPGLGVLNKE